VSASRLSAAPAAGGGARLTAVTGSVLGIDFGTSNTAAALHRGGQPAPLLFDGSPLLPSAICLAPDASLLVGRDAGRRLTKRLLALTAAVLATACPGWRRSRPCWPRPPA
jgi:hypothetical protein